MKNDDMKIISLLTEKGGSGKSTLAINLATALHREGQRVVLIDADPQGTTRDWREASPEGSDLPPVVPLDRPQVLAQSVKSLHADIVVIDTPAKAEGMAATVIRISDVALIVLQPSAADIWAAAATVKLIQQKRDVGGQVECAFLVNRTASNTKLSREIREGKWNEYGIDQLEATIGNRASFAQAMSEGVSVLDLGDQAAKNEIKAVLEELRKANWC